MSAPRRAWFVPGRIEVLGKHTDYAGGRSLLCAIDRGFRVTAAPRADNVITLRDPGQGLSAQLVLDPTLPEAPGHWTTYARVVARRLAAHFPSARRGADITFSSDLPPAAGISSSTAFVIATYLALAAVNDIEQDDTYRAAVHRKEDLAEFLGGIESGYGFGPFQGDRGVGSFGGSQDHTAILCCERDRLAMYAFNPVRHERTIPLSPDLRFVIGSSGIVAAKAGAARDAYNRASVATKRILALWNAQTGRSDPSLAAAIRSRADAPDRLRDAIRAQQDAEASYLLGRFDQFYAEAEEIIPAAADALERSDYASFGQLVDRSQRLAETRLGNQVPQTIALATSARTLGALAASAFGAGFGGSVWALVPAAEADAFTERWSSGYRQAYPESSARAVFFTTRASDAAREITEGN